MATAPIPRNAHDTRNHRTIEHQVGKDHKDHPVKPFWERATVTPRAFVLASNFTHLSPTLQGWLPLKLVPQRYKDLCTPAPGSDPPAQRRWNNLDSYYKQTAALFHPSISYHMCGRPAFGMGLECISNIQWGLM